MCNFSTTGLNECNWGYDYIRMVCKYSGITPNLTGQLIKEGGFKMLVFGAVIYDQKGSIFGTIETVINYDINTAIYDIIDSNGLILTIKAENDYAIITDECLIEETVEVVKEEKVKILPHW